MEKALFVSKLESIEALLAEDMYHYLYFGNEFCEHLIPTEKEVKDALKICKNFNIKFVLVTPYVAEHGLENLKKLLDMLVEYTGTEDFEIIINDWGVYHFCKQLGIQHIIVGRLLNKMERDMRIEILCDKDSGLYEYLKSPSILSDCNKKFLNEVNIKRVEFDNVFQGINLNYLDESLKYSLYYPYLYVTTSRLCPDNSHYFKDETCKKNCYYNHFDYIFQEESIQFYVKGKTVFARNDELPLTYEKYFDRLIIEKTIPH